jgi:hypothetical protein
VAIGGEKNDSPHLEFKQRWVNQFNFYVNDQHWGRNKTKLMGGQPPRLSREGEATDQRTTGAFCSGFHRFICASPLLRVAFAEP